MGISLPGSSFSDAHAAVSTFVGNGVVFRPLPPEVTHVQTERRPATTGATRKTHCGERWRFRCIRIALDACAAFRGRCRQAGCARTSHALARQRLDIAGAAKGRPQCSVLFTFVHFKSKSRRSARYPTICAQQFVSSSRQSPIMALLPRGEWHPSVTGRILVLPARSRGAAQMQQRRRIKQILSLEDRLAAEARRLRQEARQLPPGIEREKLIRRARQAEAGSHVSAWLRSPGHRSTARP